MMGTCTVVLGSPLRSRAGVQPHLEDIPDSPEPLLREALGGALRAFRADKGVTLRELAEASNVSPGYLSELERGRKEVSSELLASVCTALGTTVADVLFEAAEAMAMEAAQAQLAKV